MLNWCICGCDTAIYAYYRKNFYMEKQQLMQTLKGALNRFHITHYNIYVWIQCPLDRFFCLMCIHLVPIYVLFLYIHWDNGTKDNSFKDLFRQKKKILKHTNLRFKKFMCVYSEKRAAVGKMSIGVYSTLTPQFYLWITRGITTTWHTIYYLISEASSHLLRGVCIFKFYPPEKVLYLILKDHMNDLR